MSAATERPNLTIIIMNFLLKALSQHAAKSGMITKLGPRKSAKMTGQPVVTSWGKARESQSSFFHEKTQHDEVIPRDRTGQPVVIPQRGARPQQFIIGDDEAELELSSGSRSFLDRVNIKCAKDKNVFDECYRKRRKTFCEMENVHVCNIRISVIHGKELLRQLAFHHKYKRLHNETNVRHICEIGVRTR